jgi:BASS family bile acid:Na+ symporter
MENAKQLVGLLVQASMFLMIMAVAMQCPWRDVVDQLRRPTFLLRALVAVNVVVPGAAILLALAMGLPQPVAAGLLLMAVSPLAPLVPGNALKTGAARSYILAVYLLLVVLAIPIVPITVQIVDAIFGAEASISPASLASIVFISGVLPIALGLILAALAPRVAQRAAGPVTLASSLVLALFVLIVLWMQGRVLLHLIGNGTIIAFGLTVAAGIAAGHLLGGKDPENRGALAIAAAIRHPGIAIAIAHASGAGPGALAAIILFLLNGVIIVSIYVAWLKKHQVPADAAEKV